MKILTKLHWIVAFFTLLLVGCGGGGGGGSASGSARLFLTDSFNDDYSQVWLRIHKVELRNQATVAWATAFESNAGVLIDAKTLRDVSGARFSLLANGVIPLATYDAVRITFEDKVVLVPAGGGSGLEKTVDDNGGDRDNQNRPRRVFSLNPPINAGGSDVIIDIDLANFTLTFGGTKVLMSLQQGSNSGLNDPNRHELEDYHGTIANLSSSSFTLNTTGGGPLNVRYDGTTVIFRESTGASATLANGQFVEIDARWDASQGALIAKVIKIEDGNSPNEAEVKGGVTNLNLAANVMTLTNIREVENFTPQGSTVTVLWTNSTVFRRSGDIVTEEFLKNFNIAEAKGSYNVATNTLTATRITLEDENGPGQGEAECKGTAANVNLAGDQMTLNNITQIFGFTPPPGLSITVVWNAGTVFRNGNTIATEAIVSNGGFYEVKGTYNPATQTLTAERIKVDNN